MNYFIQRLKEPSTWAAVAAFLVAAGFVTPDQIQIYLNSIGMSAAVAGMALAEKR